VAAALSTETLMMPSWLSSERVMSNATTGQRAVIAARWPVSFRAEPVMMPWAP
jgi:hypothetical protein